MNQSRAQLAGRALIRFVLLAIVIRLVRDTSLRIMYPFIPEFARGLGVSLTAMGTLLALRTVLVMLSPLFGNLADQRGPRPLLLAGIVLQGIGLLSFSFARGFYPALAAIFILGVSDSLFMPLMQAYVSEQAPANRRGWALATVEYSWAITGIVVLPLVGLLIAQAGWFMPFRLLSIGSIVSFLVLFFLLPADAPRRNAERKSLWTQAGDILRDRSAAASILVNGAIFMAAETFFVIWGVHLEANFALGPVEIGQVASIIGASELGGSILSSLLIDKLGRRRGVFAGVLTFLVAVALLPWLNRSLWPLVAGLALVSLALEYSIVSNITLLSDQRPSGRATMLAMGAMSGAAIRGVTDSAVVWLFENGSFLATVLYAFTALLVAAFVLWRWVEERRER